MERKHTFENKADIRRHLEKLAEPDYQKFAVGLLKKPDSAIWKQEEQDVPDTEEPPELLGVRLPMLRDLAKKLAKEDLSFYREISGGDSFEEIMLQGFLLALRPVKKKEDFQLLLQDITEHVPKISNWSLCDSFCTSLKSVSKYPDEFLAFLKNYLASKKEYEVRFAVVCLLDFYIKEEYIDRLFPIWDQISHPGYYVKMAVAWAVSMCFVKFPEKTWNYLSDNKLDDFTYQKALQKITESNRVDGETKKRIRAMRTR